MQVIDLLIAGASNPTIASTIEDINASTSCQKFNIVGFLDNYASENDILGYPVIGGFHKCQEFSKNLLIVNTVASSCRMRHEVSTYFLERGWSFANIIHPSVDIRHVEMGNGNIVYEKAMLHPRVKLGSFNIVSSLSGVAHDTCLGDNNFIGPNSYVCGRVVIGNNCFFGVSSSVAPRITIHDNCVIAAASFINSDLPASSRVKGIPARSF